MGRAHGGTENESARLRCVPRDAPTHIASTRERVRAGAERVRALGEWPPYISAASITSRVPDGEQTATGFDAGVACSLDLIPREKQLLSARLHAAYTPDAVAQVRRESTSMHPQSETTWWLAACSVCEEGALTEQQFMAQLAEFNALAKDPVARQITARAALEEMSTSFELRDGVAYGTEDGCMQGAYVAGHDVATMYAQEADLYFVGTLRPSLELDDFSWQHPPNPEAQTRDQQLGRSGPVHGSKQFVKCADAAEYQRVLAHVRSRLGDNAF